LNDICASVSEFTNLRTKVFAHFYTGHPLTIAQDVFTPDPGGVFGEVAERVYLKCPQAEGSLALLLPEHLVVAEGG
jgi:hypothetical protein